jgi:hypothetical protein
MSHGEQALAVFRQERGNVHQRRDLPRGTGGSLRGNDSAHAVPDQDGGLGAGAQRVANASRRRVESHVARRRAVFADSGQVE